MPARWGQKGLETRKKVDADESPPGQRPSKKVRQLGDPGESMTIVTESKKIPKGR